MNTNMNNYYTPQYRPVPPTGSYRPMGVPSSKWKTYGPWILGALVCLVLVVTLAPKKRPAVVAPQPPVGLYNPYPIAPTTYVESRTSRPISTPTNLGSKSGLGGGPLVGSQSTRIGGSTFLPGRNLVMHNNNPQVRPPTQLRRAPVAPAPLAPVVAPQAPPTPAPAVFVPAADMTPSVAPAEVVVAPEEVVVAPEEVVVAPAAATTTLGGSAYQSKRSSYFGATPTPYQTVNDIIVDSRDGYIIQPR